MSPRSPTLLLTEPSMWRKNCFARVHPDAGGDHELFIWRDAIKDAVVDVQDILEGATEDVRGISLRTPTEDGGRGLADGPLFRYYAARRSMQIRSYGG